MAALTVAPITLAGILPALVAAAGGGDTFANDGRTYLHVKNAGGAPIDVTVDSVQACNYGFDHNNVVSVAAGAEKLMGPFPVARFGASCAVTYSGVTSVTVQARQVPQA